MKRLASVIAATLLVASTGQAQVLNFEGIAPYPHNSTVLIQNFYNGGAASNGSIGPNFGVTLSSNAQLYCLSSLTVGCGNASRGGLGDPTSAEGGLWFESGNQIMAERAAGFSSAFSFLYNSPGVGGSVSVWDGLGGTGNLLASAVVPIYEGSCYGYNGWFCPLVPFSIAFAGTAYSVTIQSLPGEIVFDDLTFGSETPGVVVPEPATMALTVTGLVALLAARRRRRRA